MATPVPPRWLVWLALVPVLPAAAHGNAGPPGSGGHRVGEPVGIKDVAITRETLTIDLRPLASGGLAKVEAVYHLNNQGPEKSLDLLFASGASGVTDFEVWLGDRRVPAAPAAAASMPSDWIAPADTPALHGGRALEYRHGVRSTTPVGFTVIIPSGPAIMTVRYAAEAATHQDGHPTVYRQFAYVLAPARAWAGFGGLDVTVHLPPGWNAASSPSLQRDGDALVGSFPDVPANSIRLTVQAPAGPAYQPARYATIALLGLTLVAGPVWCWRGGRTRGRQIARAAGFDEPGPRTAVPRSFGLAVLWALAVFAAGLLAMIGPNLVLPPGQANQYGYGAFFAVFGLIVICLAILPVGFLIAQVTAVVAASARPRD